MWFCHSHSTLLYSRSCSCGISRQWHLSCVQIRAFTLQALGQCRPRSVFNGLSSKPLRWHSWQTLLQLLSKISCLRACNCSSKDSPVELEFIAACPRAGEGLTLPRFVNSTSKVAMRLRSVSLQKTTLRWDVLRGSWNLGGKETLQGIGGCISVGRES